MEFTVFRGGWGDFGCPSPLEHADQDGYGHTSRGLFAELLRGSSVSEGTLSGGQPQAAVRAFGA